MYIYIYIQTLVYKKPKKGLRHGPLYILARGTRYARYAMMRKGGGTPEIGPNSHAYIKCALRRVIHRARPPWHSRVCICVQPIFILYRI